MEDAVLAEETQGITAYATELATQFPDVRIEALPIPFTAVATDLNGRLKQCCKSSDSPSGAMLEMRSHLVLFSRYGLPNEKATQLVRDLAMQAFTPPKR